MSVNRDDRSGVSYADVALLMAETGREHNGDVSLIVIPPRSTGRGVTLHVCASFEPRTLGRVSARRACKVSRPWPSGECSTMAGMMLRVVWDLTKELDEQEAEAARLSQGRLL